MRIYPQDLAPEWHARIILQRCLFWEQQSGLRGPARPEPPPRELSTFDRLMGSLSGLPAEEAEAALPAARKMAAWQAALPWLIAGWFPLMTAAAGLVGKMEALPAVVSTGALTALTGGLSLAWPRFTLRRMHRRPLTPGEVDSLLETARNETEREFLALLRDAARQEVPEAAREKIRLALRSLSETLDRLPVLHPAALDGEALCREADELLSRARSETDRVTAESLERRAHALHYRLQANARTALVARRADALRAEILAQIAALRDGLVALQAAAPDAVGLAELAEAARTVATEAGEVAAARDELETAVHAWPAVVSEEAARLQAHRG